MAVFLILILCVLGTIAVTCAMCISLAADQKNATDHAAKKYLKIVGGIWIFFLIMVGINAFDHRDSKNVRIALEYSRMPPLPMSAKVLKTKCGDSLFARNIWVTFQAPLSEIKGWIDVAKEIKPEQLMEDDPKQGFRRYSVPINNDALWGEIEVNETSETVILHAGYS